MRRWILTAALFAALLPCAFAKPPAPILDAKPTTRAPRAPDAKQVDAARLLTQATFGPTLEEIARAAALGPRAWVDEQLAAPPSTHLGFYDAVGGRPATMLDNLRMEAWLQRALYAPDQLRQRVAFALSEIFVVSERAPALSFQHEGLASYYDVLVEGAFGSYRDLLGNVTRHPAMGIYLSMRGNRKADEALRIKPDENFAREVMQLFAIGLHVLERDGTLRDGDPSTPGVQPIPTYEQDVVRELARVFTGWNWPSCASIPESRATEWPACAGAGEWRSPMAATTWAHDTGSKRLLSYDGAGRGSRYVIPANLAPEAELDLALDHLANHPNVGPYIVRQLIQRLVTSNPSPAYVARVAAVFEDDGRGQRGNLGAVVAAILLDAEARDPAIAESPAYGKLREPLLRYTHLMRAFDGRTVSGRLPGWDPLPNLGQAPLWSPSVFNFFRPDYSHPGEIADLGLDAPEFAITGESDVLKLTRWLSQMFFTNFDRDMPVLRPDAVTLDLPREEAHAIDARALVARYQLVLMNGRMPPAMRDELAAAIGAMPVETSRERRNRVKVAAIVIATSPQYAIQK